MRGVLGNFENERQKADQSNLTVPLSPRLLHSLVESFEPIRVM
jgi:hypothetical protein